MVEDEEYYHKSREIDYKGCPAQGSTYCRRVHIDLMLRGCIGSSKSLSLPIGWPSGISGELICLILS
jgi:hypothetical protein